MSDLEIPVEDAVEQQQRDLDKRMVAQEVPHLTPP